MSPRPKLVTRLAQKAPSRASENPRPHAVGVEAWALLAIGACTLIAYLGLWHSGFIWDDDAHLTRPDLQSLAGLWRIWWVPGATQQFYPVLHSLFWFEHRLFGDGPLGYHLVNLLLHVGAAYLFYRVLRRLEVPGALFACAVFAVHPVEVETVAWVSEQKNTLSAVFGFSTALAYLHFDASRRRGWYAAASVLFVLALLSKSVTATLPAVLLVLFWWKRGRLAWRVDVLPLVPWFLAGALFGAITAWVEHRFVGASGSAIGLGPVDRVLVAGRALWFYLGKLLWPSDLVFIYPRWHVDPHAALQYVYPTVALGVLGALAALARRSRGPLAAALLFAGVLFPALGFFDVFPFIYSFVADHFQYLASAAVIAAVCAACASASRALPLAVRAAAAAALVGVLAVLTWRQAAMYQGKEALWRTTLERNPECWMAYNNLGVLEVGKGHVDEAVADFKRAADLNPKFAEAFSNLGEAAVKRGHPAEAVGYYERAAALAPSDPWAPYALATVLARLNRLEEAIPQFQRALQINPGNADARFNLGNAWASKGRLDEAAAQWRATLEVDPRYARAHNNLGNVALIQGRTDEAIAHYRRALEIDPVFREARRNLGVALIRSGHADEGRAELQGIP